MYLILKLKDVNGNILSYNIGNSFALSISLKVTLVIVICSINFLFD